MSELSFACRKDVVGVQSPIDEDEENEGPGRILTVEELIVRLRGRTDIFGVDRNNRLRNTEIIMMCIAAAAGMLFSSIRTSKINTDFYQHDPNLNDGTITVKTDFIDRQSLNKNEPKIPSVANSDAHRPLKRAKNVVNSKGPAKGGSGIGSIYSRIAKTELFTLLSRNALGKDVADGEIFGKNGFAKGMDVILAGSHNGLKPGGRTSSGRRNYEGIGCPGSGAGPSGVGGSGVQGIDDLMDQLMPADNVPVSLRPPKTGPPDRTIQIHEKGAGLESNGNIIGGRNKAEITRVVMQNIGALRYAYNRCLREKPGIKGKITIRFAIDEFGNVIHCEVVSSSIIDDELESTVTAKILRWKFDRIDKPGDITEVVYPFVFST